TYTATATYAGDATPTRRSADLTVSIGKAASTMHATGDSFTYDGNTHTGGSASVSGAGIVTGSAVLSYSGDQVNAGTYTVTATYAGDANHIGSTDSSTVSIGKAASTTHATGDSFTYDGNAHTGGARNGAGEGEVAGRGGLGYSDHQVDADSYTCVP